MARRDTTTAPTPSAEAGTPGPTDAPLVGAAAAVIRPRPNLLWRLFVLGGVGTMTAVTVSDDAWEAFRGATGDAVPREQVRKLLVGTAAVHAVEALSTYLRARRIGVAHPFRWALANLIWGFPVALRLGKAKRALAAAE